MHRVPLKKDSVIGWNEEQGGYTVVEMISKTGTSSLVYRGYKSNNFKEPVIIKELYPVWMNNVIRLDSGVLIGITEAEKSAFRLQQDCLMDIRYNPAKQLVSDYFVGAKLIQDKGTLYLIMDANAEETFDHILKKMGPIGGKNRKQKIEQLIRRIEYVKRIIEAVNIMHERGYIHGDLKPANLFCSDLQQDSMEERRTIKVLDFGSCLPINVTSEDKTLFCRVTISRGYAPKGWRRIWQEKQNKVAEGISLDALNEWTVKELQKFEDLRYVDIYAIGIIFSELVFQKTYVSLNQSEIKQAFHNMELLDDEVTYIEDMFKKLCSEKKIVKSLNEFTDMLNEFSSLLFYNLSGHVDNPINFNRLILKKYNQPYYNYDYIFNDVIDPQLIVNVVLWGKAFRVEDLYVKAPGCYLFEAQGGMGKTVAFKYAAQKLMGLLKNNQQIVAIYIPLELVNRGVNLNTSLLLQVIRTFYLEAQHDNGFALEDIHNLFKFEGYRYVLLLDGFNEVRDDLVARLENEIQDLKESDRVDIIISSRPDSFSNKKIFGSNIGRFEGLHLNEIRMLLNINSDIQVPTFVNTILLLKMFNIIKANENEFQNEYQLIEGFVYHYLKKENVNQHQFRYLIEYEFPNVAIELTLAQMKSEHLQNDFSDKLSSFENVGWIFHLDQGRFVHDLLREYFAAKWIYMHINECSMDECRLLENFFNGMHESMKYKRYDQGINLARRGVYLQQAELIYGIVGDSLDKKLAICFRDSIRYEEIAYHFYEDFADLFDDLAQKTKGAVFARTAYSLLQRLEYLYSHEELAELYNKLFYDGNLKENYDMYETAMVHLKIAGLERHRALHARLISNEGAYYYARKKYEDAYSCYEKALDLRMRIKKMQLDNVILEGMNVNQATDIDTDICTTYKNMMSANYMRGKFKEAFQNYKEALRVLLGRNIQLRDIQIQKLQGSQINVYLVERVLGSEIKLLNDSDLRDEILEHMPIQVEYIIDTAIESEKQVNFTLLKSLHEKLEQLILIDGNITEVLRAQFEEDKNRIEDYINW